MEAKLVEERQKRVLIEDECRRLTEQDEQVQHNRVCVLKLYCAWTSIERVCDS